MVVTSPTEKIDSTGVLPAEFVRNDAVLVLARSTSDTDLCLRWADDPEQTDKFLFPSGRYSPLQYPLAESWVDHPIPLVISKFSYDMANGEAQSIFNAIPRIISKAEEGSVLYRVCNAVGCAFIARATRYPTAARDQARAYGTALAAVNLALRDPQQYKSDSILLGVWLLSLYEVRSQT